MRTFEEYCKKRQDEGFGRNLALGAALVSGGLAGNKLINPAAPQAQQQVQQQQAQQPGSPAPQVQQQAPQSQDDGEDILAPSDRSWNSDLGDFRTFKLKDGSYIYRTAKGDFKQVNSPITGSKFVRVK